MISDIVVTIGKQIRGKELKWAGFELIQVDENTLRVHKGKKNMDITYNPYDDLYVIHEHKIKKSLDVETTLINRIFAEQLKEFIEEFFNFEYINRNIKVIGVNA